MKAYTEHWKEVSLAAVFIDITSRGDLLEASIHIAKLTAIKIVFKEVTIFLFY